MAKMQIAPEDRPKVKLQCLRILATLKLDKARATLISVFMDSYLKLTAAEMVVYNQELQAMEPKEREAVMEVNNEWTQIGREQGRVQGRAQGKEQGELEGRRKIILRILGRRFGGLSDEIVDRIENLTASSLDELGDALLDFQSISDGQLWLSQHG